MLARLLRLRLALLLASFVGFATVLHAFPSSAWAQDDDDDDDDDDDGGGGGGDDDDDDETPQPPVTSGGLYTKKTWPITELERPLTVIGGMFEARAGIDIDVSKDTAFEIWRAKLDARYGVKDFLELQGGLSAVLTGDIAAGSLFSMYGGFESSIMYDLVDFRFLVELPLDPEFKFDMTFGFPFRYKPKPNVAIIALDKIMTIHTDGAKPDLTIGVGLIFQVIKNFAVLGRGEVTIPQFNTDVIIIPATVAFQFSPNNKFDLGGEFTLGNLKVSDPVKPWDQRSLLLYLQARF
jgi:hypothetical protein